MDIGLHCLRLPQHVHEDYRNAGIGNQFRHSLLSCPVNIVDKRCAGIECRSGHLRLGSVYGYGGIRYSGKFLYYGNYPFQFLICAHGVGKWPGGFPAYVNDIRTLFNHPLGMFHCGFHIQKFATIREGIRRYIQYAHYERPLKIGGLRVLPVHRGRFLCDVIQHPFYFNSQLLQAEVLSFKTLCTLSYLLYASHQKYGGVFFRADNGSSRNHGVTTGC